MRAERTLTTLKYPHETNGWFLKVKMWPGTKLTGGMSSCLNSRECFHGMGSRDITSPSIMISSPCPTIDPTLRVNACSPVHRHRHSLHDRYALLATWAYFARPPATTSNRCTGTKRTKCVRIPTEYRRPPATSPKNGKNSFSTCYDGEAGVGRSFSIDTVVRGSTERGWHWMKWAERVLAI